MLNRAVNQAVAVSIAICVWMISAPLSAAVDFESEIEPLFQTHCLDCHGPDEQNSRFRIDRLSVMLRGGDSGEPAVVPGDPSSSFLLRVLRHQEPGLEMPPDGALSEEEIQRIDAWIAEGAKTPPRYGSPNDTTELSHWAFQRVIRPSSADSIDGFLVRKLQDQGLSFSKRADRRVLIRRLFLVVLGLPPTPQQVHAFIHDDRDDAWPRLVEQVLASPHYGERLASLWLDLIRFGETHGYEMNRERPTAWPFRDWVIRSFNEDKPYDQFIREQIAGDALGDELGTGFLVAGPVDQVKGQDKKLQQIQRMNELDDMINTCGTAFLGLTTGCARCHNHKFDPITQKDYYAMQAVFAGVQFADGKLRRTDQQQARIASIDQQVANLESSLSKFVINASDQQCVVAIDDGAAEHLQEPKGNARDLAGPKPGFSGDAYTWWESEPGQDVVRYRPRVRGRYRIWISWGAGFETHSTDARYCLETSSGREEIAKVNQQLLADGSGQVDGVKRWSGFLDAGVHQLQTGDCIVLQGGQQGKAITSDVVVFQEVTDDGEREMPTLRASVRATGNVENFGPRKARFVRFSIDATNGGEPCIDELRIFSGGQNVALASVGAKASSSGDFQHPLHKLVHINDDRFGNSRSWISAQSSGGWVQIELPQVTAIDRIEWARDREGKYGDRLATQYRIECGVEDGDWELIASSADRMPFDSTAAATPQYVFEMFSEREAEQGRQWLNRLEELRAEKAKIEASRTAWIGSFTQPGPTHRLYRGEPDAPREQVDPDAINAFVSLQLETDSPEQSRRLAFANWTASRDNPLTARVMVNRLWQFHFGAGIVDTPSDFGRNGVSPTHPELLDWLATELMDSGWSLKHIHRLILHSKAWCQDSQPNAEAIRIDAQGRLLWRFTPRRLEAEGIRDAILSVSGVLDLDHAGGPGFSAFEVEMENVRHYHPKEEYGADDWRRMIYMTKVRQEKDQVFGAFDCPDASMVVPKRSRSTTPLQALNLLNSRFVLQQSEIFAERLTKEASTEDERIQLAWQLCFQREPTETEIAASRGFIQQSGLVQFARAVLNTNEFVFIP